jgi:hypothetical protein
MNFRIVGLASVYVCAFSALPAWALIINGDIQRAGSPANVLQTGRGVVGTTGDFWNGINVSAGPSTITNLADATGAATGISFSLTLLNSPEIDSTTAGGAAKPYPETFNGLFKEYGYNITSTPLAFSFSNLDSTKSYNLHLFGAVRVGGADYAGSWVVNGVRKTTAPSSSADSGFLSSPTLTEGLQYASFSGLATTELSPGVFGLSGTFGAADASVVVWNGWQLVAVPEPAQAAALAGMASGAFVGMRRRRSWAGR